MRSHGNAILLKSRVVWTLEYHIPNPNPDHKSIRNSSGLRTSKLTLWEAVPHLQPIVLALALRALQGVIFQVEGKKGERDVHVRRNDDDEGAFQIVGVFVWKAG